MELLVRLDGIVAEILDAMVRIGYYKTKSEAVRAGILELGSEYQLVGKEAALVAKRVSEMEAQVRSGKKKLVSIEEVARKAGVKI